MLHVSAPKKRRVESVALLDLVVIGKIADEDVNDLLLGFVDVDRSQAGKQLVHPGKKKFRVLIPVVADGFELPLKQSCLGLTGRPGPIQNLTLCIPHRHGRHHSPQKQLPMWRPRDTPMPLELAATAASRTTKVNHVDPPSQGQE